MPSEEQYTNRNPRCKIEDIQEVFKYMSIYMSKSET